MKPIMKMSIVQLQNLKKKKTFSQSPGESPQLLGHLRQQKDVFGKKLEGDFERTAEQKV